jgi:CHAT domain-containing protein
LAVGAPQDIPRTRPGGSWSRPRSGWFESESGTRGHDLPSLPFSRKEILDIASLFPAPQVDVLTGEMAAEGRIKGLALTDYRIIHFATHGLLDERFPYRSALILSPMDGAEEDGRLQTREIYGLTMNAGLVVLSACQTARGRLEDTEGPMALARPFFFAGARSVIASLWQINDRATVQFMGEFYRSLVLGQTKAESLRAAKLRMLGSAWAHPYYWAGFLLQGDPSVLGVASGDRDRPQ